jgi:hypothetical protein
MVTGHSPTQSGPVASGTVSGGLHLRKRQPKNQGPAVPDRNGKGGGDVLDNQSPNNKCMVGRAADNVDDPHAGANKDAAHSWGDYPLPRSAQIVADEE